MLLLWLGCPAFAFVGVAGLELALAFVVVVVVVVVLDEERLSVFVGEVRDERRGRGGAAGAFAAVVAV